MSVDDVCCAARREDNSHLCRIRCVQRRDSCVRLANKTGKARLPCRVAHGLCECRGWDRDPRSELGGPCQQREHASIASIHGDQAAGVKRYPAHAALRRRLALDFDCGLSIESAQSRSLLVSGPPVSVSAAASIAPQPAISASATATACFTNPETLWSLPAATNSRIATSCSSSNVIVTLVVAIPGTILRAGATKQLAWRDPRRWAHRLRRKKR